MIANGFVSGRHRVMVGSDRGHVCVCPQAATGTALPQGYGKDSVPLLGSKQGCNVRVG